jgi:HEAT repeat protein
MHFLSQATAQPFEPARSLKKVKRLLFFGVAPIFTACLIFWFNSRPSLVYKGKPAAYWISRLNYFNGSGGVSAEAFLFEAGPGVVPELVKGLSLRDARIHDRWVDLYFKLGKWQKYFSYPVKRSAYRANCARGLGIIGPPAEVTVPELLNALNDSDLWVRSAAAEALGRIGAKKEIVVPALITGLQSTNRNLLLPCEIALTHFVPGSAQAADALRTMLRKNDINLQCWAAAALGRDDSMPEQTFHALGTALHNSNPTLQLEAAKSLGHLSWSDESKARVLLETLVAEKSVRPKDSAVVGGIIEALGEIGPAAAAAIDVLQDFAQTTNTYQINAIVTLTRIDPASAGWKKELAAKSFHDERSAFYCALDLGLHGSIEDSETLRQIAARAKNPQIRAMALIGLWRVDPNSPEPIAELSAFLLEPFTGGKYEPIMLLGKVGSRARAMIPVLRQLRYGRGPMMRDYAETALNQIDPSYITDPWKK